MDEKAIMERFEDFLTGFKDMEGRRKYYHAIKKALLVHEKDLVIDYGDLYRHDEELALMLDKDPKHVLTMFENKLREIIKDDFKVKPGRIKIRIRNHYAQVPIREVKSEHINRLVQVEGIVTRMYPMKVKILKGLYVHTKCGGQFMWPPEDEENVDRLNKPSVCPICGEEGGRFKLISEQSELADWQKIVLQEKPENVPGGQVPKNIEVHLSHNLAYSVKPGDKVKIVGIVKTKTPENPRDIKYDLYIEAIDVEALEEHYVEELSQEDIKAIKELAKDPQVKDKIIDSIAVGIHGNRDLKEAIALALFGGVSKEMPDGTRIRGDIHVLFIGDPGVGKSQILTAASKIAPRAIYTTGKGSSAAGLTVTVLRDRNTGEYFLEAGAMVLADKGVLVIDEIDKMESRDRDSLHEAMEQQQVSVSKAGIVARLNSRTTVIAAGNPKLGLYDTNRAFMDNVNLPSTILSRFDLVFAVKDVISKERDVELASHILRVHEKPDSIEPSIEPKLLKKYIMYAREHIKPKLTEEAAQVIENFFLSMREAMASYLNSSPASLPIVITPRQLESLVRIAEAHAKMALREEVTEEDAKAAVRIMRESLKSIGFNIEEGPPAIKMVEELEEKRKSKKPDRKEMVAVILELIEKKIEKQECAEEEELLKELESAGFDAMVVRMLIKKLLSEGKIYQKIPECYRPA